MMHKFYCSLFLVLLLFTNANAQLCQGSLGDPIINITFGSGSNPGPSLPAVTGYQYITADCPSDGYYTVRNNTNACFGDTWHTLLRDHTGNSNGYFMLVNASYQPSEFYLDTVKGLCSNTTYEFAAWIINVLKSSACNNAGILPNLTFKIEKTDGTLLKSYNTGNITSSASPIWNQYGFFFTTPIGISDVVLRITNNSQGGCGNDLALDDITFKPCGPLLTPSFSDVQSTTKNLCDGDNKQVVLNCNVSAGYNNPSYQWQQSLDNGGSWSDMVGETSTTLIKIFSAAVVGNYMYRLTAAEAGNMSITKCRVASQALTIKVNAKPTTTAFSNSPICEKQDLLLNATGGIFFLWNGPNNFSDNTASPTIGFVQQINAGKYYVTVTDYVGCSKLDSTNVVVNVKPQIAVNPTATNLCEGDSTILIATGAVSYLWQPSTGLSSSIASSPKASPLDTTIYKVIGTAQNSCTDTAFITVNIIKKPIVNAGPNKNLIEGQSLQLFGSITGNYLSFNWTPIWQIDNSTSLQPFVNPLKDTFYVLNATAINGCGIIKDTVAIKVYKKIVIPNSFSPNGDGINDTWNIDALVAYPNAEVLVFNRQGQIVFKKTNYTSWDGKFNGKPLPVGTYYYIINLREAASAPITGWLEIVH